MSFLLSSLVHTMATPRPQRKAAAAAIAKFAGMDCEEVELEEEVILSHEEGSRKRKLDLDCGPEGKKGKKGVRADDDALYMCEYDDLPDLETSGVQESAKIMSSAVAPSAPTRDPTHTSALVHPPAPTLEHTRTPAPGLAPACEPGHVDPEANPNPSPNRVGAIATDAQAERIVQAISKWSLDGLKAFIRRLQQLRVSQSTDKLYPGSVLKMGTKQAMLEDLRVVVHAALTLGEGVVQSTSYHRDQQVQFESARIHNAGARPTYRSRPPAREAILRAFHEAEEEVACAGRQKGRSEEAKRLELRFQALDKPQLLRLLMKIVDSHPELVPELAVDGGCPMPDLGALLDERHKLVKAIYKAVPNSRFGSQRDDYCYARCASAVAAAKTALLKPVTQYKACKQWDVALAYAEGALPIAREMPQWDHENNNSARNGVIEALQELVSAARIRRHA